MQNKKHLILLHGALGSLKQFDKIKDYLDSDFIVHCFDLPAHGSLSYQRTQSNILNFVNFVRNYIFKNKLEKPYVFGSSMGGYIALTLQSQSNIFSKIMTLNTKFEWNTQNAENQAKMFNPQIILEKVPHYAEYLISLHSTENWEYLLDMHKNLISNLPQENLLTDYALNKIAIPVLLTRGEKDNMVTEFETLNVMEKLKNCEYYMFQNTEHPIEKIDTLLLTNKIIDFLG